MSPPLILLLSMATVVGLIVVFRVHAFLALVAGGLLVGILSPHIPVATAPATLAANFGRVAGSVAIVIALASVIAMCLLESGAAERISRQFLRLFGEARAHLSLWSSGTVLAVPVFFDTVFYLLLPLARAMSVRQKRHYALNVMAISAGGAAAHVFVPPTPGPLAAGAALGVDLGLMIVMGIVVAVPASLAAVAYAQFYERRWPKPVPPLELARDEDLDALTGRPDERLPGFGVSLLPIVLPVLLIGSRTATAAFVPGTPVAAVAEFAGDANLALFGSAVIALLLLKRRAGLTLAQLADRTETALLGGGVIILITSAGGAYGWMLSQAEVGQSLQGLSTAAGLPAIWLAFLIASVMKIAQGSSTVAIITAASILQTIYAGDGGAGLPNPVYAALAAGGGSLVASWMNDSGFWIVSKMGGFSARDTFGIWTVTAAIVGSAGFVVVLILSWLLPLN